MTETERFWSLLDATFVQVQRCWNRENQSLDMKGLDDLLGVASSGERHMALFFRDLWLGQGSKENPFDLIDAVASLDRAQVAIIQKWLSAPFWP